MADTTPLIVPRLYQRCGLGEENTQPQSLENFLTEPAIVLLGDPGSGKTTSFEHGAYAESAEKLTVGQFLSDPPEPYKGRTLYLDALDERRSFAGETIPAIQSVVGKLKQLGKPPFRLSCREADWYFEIDQNELLRASPSKSLCVLRLQPLDDDDVKAIATSEGQNGEEFLGEAVRRNIRDWLNNPLNLRLLLQVIKAGGWPTTRIELFKKASEKLILEQNPIHTHTQVSNLDQTSLIDAAGYISAVLLLANKSGIALSRHAESEETPAINNLNGFSGNASQDLVLMGIAARSRLFNGVGGECVKLMHRAMAEYLAARFLAGRIRTGLLLGRALSLMCGSDGVPPTQLRGLFAWFVVQVPESADQLIPIDPFALIVYGDPSLLSHTLRLSILKALENLEKQHPWYRHDVGLAEVFGTLGQSDMEPQFKTLLEDPAKPPVLISIVLDAIKHGQFMPALGAQITTIVRDESRPDWVRRKALNTFFRICPENKELLLSMLIDIHSGDLKDPDNELRAELIKLLFPANISPSEIHTYIIPNDPNNIGTYYTVVEYFILEHCPITELPSLLDSLVNILPFPGDITYTRTGSRLIGHGVVTALENFGTNIPASQIYTWLGATIGEHGEPIIRNDDSKAITTWIENHPEKLFEILNYWLEMWIPTNSHSSDFWTFERRIHHPKFPDDFVDWAVGRVKIEEDEIKAIMLFEQAVLHFYLQESPDPGKLQMLHDFSEEEVRFFEVMQSMSYREIPDWRLEEALNGVNRIQERQQEHDARIEALIPQLEAIRAGKQISGLNHLAKVYFALYMDVDENKPQTDRLETTYNLEITAIAIEGFIAALYGNVRLTPKDIGEREAENKHYPWGFVVLAGMNEIFKMDPQLLLDLPNDILESAIAFKYANTVTPSEKHHWINLLIRERPEIAKNSLNAYWRPQLAKEKEHVIGLYQLANDDDMSYIAENVAITLLKEFPYCRLSYLGYLLGAALKGESVDELFRLCQTVLAITNPDKALQKALWHAVSYLISPVQQKEALQSFVGSDKSLVGAVLNFLVRNGVQEDKSLHTLSIAQQITLIETCGAVFGPVELRESGIVPPEYDLADKIKFLINSIGESKTTKATEGLEYLYGLSTLSSWKNSIAHAKVFQSRLRRDAEFSHFTVPQIVATLNSGPPANVRDLQALLVELLTNLKKDLRDGPTDGWKGFWNIDSNAKVKSPRVEDDCRDRILERINPRLATLSVTAVREGYYAESKRSDIKCLMPNINLPIEIKRQNHPELWSAAKSQLNDRYARDPEADGYGIYLVLWFGGVKNIPKPPVGIERPESAHDLESALNQSLPSELAQKVTIVVFDLSNPAQ